MRIGIVGLGAIGGAVAARLLATKPPDEELVLAGGARATSLRELSVDELRVPVQVHAALPAASYDLVLLCTRAEATDAALDGALPYLAADGAVVCLQNGLPEERVARRAGAERTLGCVINWSATAEEPGRIVVTGRGNFLLGGPRPERAAGVLSRAFPVRVTENLAGARWSKLALNCAISTLGAISGLTFGELAASRLARGLALRVIAEVCAVARAKGVRLERVSGVDPRWFAAGPLGHALFWFAARQRPQQKSGMLPRLLAGRTSGQIDDLNGAVVAQGFPAPLNARLTQLVHEIERGERRVSPSNLLSVEGR